MAFFKIEEIDRGIEWAIRDICVAKGLDVDLRTYISSGDTAAYDAAVKLMDPRVETFGVGVYKDREQLKQNNIIIEMIDIEDGDIGFTPVFQVTKNDVGNNYSTKEIGAGTYNIMYEIRFFCSNINIDRRLNEVIMQALGRGKYINGIKDAQLNVTDSQFFVTRLGAPSNLSSDKFMERVFFYEVHDAELEEETVINNAIAPTTEVSVSITPNIDKKDQDPADWLNDPETATIRITAETFDETFDETFG